MKFNLENKQLYELTLSQEVTTLQCKYTIFKRIMNILTSMTSKTELDFEVLKKAFNIVAQRNDCLRLKFVKHNGKLMQFFEDKVEFNIPVMEFNTKQEQEKFINKVRRKTIGYKKGEVVEPYFIKTHDKKFMVLMKVAHLILDIYGINMIYKDLFEVYDALKNNKEMPPMPVQFEEIVKIDLLRKHDKSFNEKNEEFYTNYFNEKEEPFYAGIGGVNSEVYKEQQRKNKRAMNMLFFDIDTKGYEHKIDKTLVEKMVDFCKETKFSFANLMFYLCSLNCAKLNNNQKNMLPLELCNCRGSYQAKACAGMRVQSLACYTSFDYEKSFTENLADFSMSQGKLYRHIGYSDTKVQFLLHSAWKSPFLSTYFALAFSFIPFVMPEDLEFFLYSNEKSVLPCYMALLYNAQKNEIIMDYDVQTKIISEEDVKNYHNSLLKLIDTVLNNPNLKLKDL